MKKLGSLLLAMMMLCLPLSGLADGISHLPDTYAELCKLLPDLPTEDPEGIAVRFPIYGGDGLSNLEIYCDNAQWASAAGQLSGYGNLSFDYNKKLGAYQMDRQSEQMYSMSTAVGELKGYVAVGNQEKSGWINNVAFYFDNEAMMQIMWNSADEWQWDKVSDFSTSNYLMACIRSRLKTKSGTVEVWRYADHTKAVLYDAKGKVKEEKTYPEYSEFCEQFMPLGAQNAD